MKCIMGADPGISGAIAFIFPDEISRVAVYDMPVVGKDVIASDLERIISQFSPDLAVIEHVHSFKGQGVASSFNFGKSYGVLLGVIGAMKIKSHLVAPTKWKRHFGLSSDKELSRALAIRTWPGSDMFRLKKHDGRAEASLLALYGASIF